MIFAIVPAAGKSERMGVPKLLLPLGKRPIIEWVLDALENSQVHRTLVVMPPNAGDLAHVVRSFSKADVAELPRQTTDMRASILHGLERVKALALPAEPEAFLVALADQPGISPQVVDQVIRQFRLHRRPIVVPTTAGRRGHPILFHWSLADQVKAIPEGHGLRYLLDQFAQQVDLVPSDDAGILTDVDTPDDYARVREQLESGASWTR